jgi:hypothetical protein
MSRSSSTYYYSNHFPSSPPPPGARHYYEYPFHALPDLGPLNGAQLKPEQLKLLASAYAWIQTHEGACIPPSTKASYSELWFILQHFEMLARFRKASASNAQRLIDQHRAEYNAVVAQKRHYYFDYDYTTLYDFNPISVIIRNCAVMEAGLANNVVGQRTTYNDDNVAAGPIQQQWLGVVGDPRYMNSNGAWAGRKIW